MRPDECAWFGLWTLIEYAPTAFARLRHYPLHEATHPQTLRTCGIGATARARVAATVGTDDPVDRLREVASRQFHDLRPGQHLVDTATIDGLQDAIHPPPWLWVWGEQRLLEVPLGGRVCVVGSRRCDNAGLRMAQRTVSSLCERGWIIVSGGALGIDSTAHRAALRAGAPTVVVLPSGLDHLYPSSNRQLFHKVLDQGGALVTPFPPWQNAKRWHFTRRNEVMAAMSVATIVVRAAPASGSLITARAAAARGRRVLAIPADGSMPEFGGTNRLIAEGAEILIDPSQPDLDHPDGARVTPERPRPMVGDLTPCQRQILEVLRGGPLHRLELSTSLGRAHHQLCAEYLDLELADLIVRQRGDIYALTTRGVGV